jgi:hypothetical protein
MVNVDYHVEATMQENGMQVVTLTNQRPGVAARQMKRGREQLCVTMRKLSPFV